MNRSDLNQLREAAWRRKLTPDEEAQLRAHLLVQSEEQTEWEEELALTSALGSLPKVPVASNFTAQVMQAARREQRQTELTESAVGLWLKRWHRYSARVAGVALILLAGLSALVYHRNASQKEFARNVAEVSALASMPGPEILQDFEAINQLRYASAASDEALIDFLR